MRSPSTAIKPALVSMLIFIFLRRASAWLCPEACLRASAIAHRRPERREAPAPARAATAPTRVRPPLLLGSARERSRLNRALGCRHGASVVLLPTAEHRRLPPRRECRPDSAAE